MLAHVQREERTIATGRADRRLHGARVIRPIDLLQSGEIQSAIVADEHPLILVDEVREVRARPVVLDGRIVLRRIAEQRFAPVAVARLFAALQIELHDVAEVQLHGLGANGTVAIAGHTVVGALVEVLVGRMDDQIAAGGCVARGGERIDRVIGEIGVDVLLLWQSE